MNNQSKEEKEEFIKAKQYDEMIPWEKRLKREIPLISEHLKPGSVLDVACSSGRHSLALEEKGYQPVGIDISSAMIGIAIELSKEKKTLTRFLISDAASEDLIEQLKVANFPTLYNNAILLGNAIANLGSFEKGKMLIQNIFLLTLPEGRFIVQTVHRPSRPHYLPLRKLPNKLIQRIMVPVVPVGPINNKGHNINLHVNVIDLETAEYMSRTSENEFYMYTKKEFAELVEDVGWKIKAVYGGYNKENVSEEDGATVVWILEKPEIPMYGETVELFRKYAQMDPSTIKKNVLKIWQRAMQVSKYHCIQGYRFLYPRITSHNKYSKISSNFKDKMILDIGCNMGTDIRKMIVDGADPEKILGIDLSSEFIDLGYELYSDKHNLASKYYVGNLTDDEFLNVKENSGSFAKYKDKIDIIHAGSLIHLLSKEENSVLFEKLHYLLNNNGIFFGRAVGNAKPVTLHHEKGLRHLYSPKSLEEHLKEQGFSNIEIVVSGKNAPIGERSEKNKLTMFFYAEKSISR